MQQITSVKELRYEIVSLEADQVIKGQILKEQLYITYESLKPVNLIRRTFKDLTSSQYLVDNIPGTIMGLVTGYLSKKIVSGGSANILRKLLGSILQFGVTNVVAKNSDVIKSVGMSAFEHFLNRKVKNSKGDVR
jgi:hypothetical protein